MFENRDLIFWGIVAVAIAVVVLGAGYYVHDYAVRTAQLCADLAR